MFGYVIPDKQNMYIKDFNVFQAFYCGLCKTLGETGSQITRLCTNYDVTFYNVLIHSLANLDVKFERKLCAYNGKKKVVVSTDELSKKIAYSHQVDTCSSQEKGGKTPARDRQDDEEKFFIAQCS